MDSITHPHADTTVAVDDSLLAIRECVPRLQRPHLDGELDGTAVAAAVVLVRSVSGLYSQVSRLESRNTNLPVFDLRIWLRAIVYRDLVRWWQSLAAVEASTHSVS